MRGIMKFGSCFAKNTLPLVAAAALAGCGFPRTAVFPPEPPDLSALTEEAAGRSYEILGVIQVDGHNFSLRNSLVSRLRAKARELGADDVIRVRVMSLPRGNGYVKYHLLTAEGIAVRWRSSATSKSSGIPGEPVKAKH